jgi:hypothetical protein
MSIHPKEACVNCHFLIEEHVTRAAKPTPLEVSEDKRARARNNDFSWLTAISTPHCSRLVWSEGFGARPDDRFKTIVETDRKDFCFFFLWRPGMLLPAAEVLEKQRADAREANKDRHWIAYGVWVAVVALIIQTILGVIALYLTALR